MRKFLLVALGAASLSFSSARPVVADTVGCSDPTSPCEDCHDTKKGCSTVSPRMMVQPTR